MLVFSSFSIMILYVKKEVYFFTTLQKNYKNLEKNKISRGFLSPIIFLNYFHYIVLHIINLILE
mgnify:CR=1 FL=1